MYNPKQGLKQILAKNNLTLGKIALLEKFECKIVKLVVDDLSDSALACWLMEQDYAEALAYTKDEAMAEALKWIDTISQDTFIKKLSKIIEGLYLYYKALPTPEENKKKKTRLGNGELIDLGEWYMSRYHVSWDEAFWVEPAHRIATVYRVYVHNCAGLQTNTWGEDEEIENFKRQGFKNG